MIPELISARLRLRTWRKEDFAPYTAFYGDKDMARYVGGTRNEIDSWNAFCAMIGEWDLRGYGTFAAEELATGAIAGYAGLWHPIDLGEPELCWGLFRDFHGRGYATEAAKRVKQWANIDLGLPPLMSYTHPDNLASQKVALRLGAECQGETTLRGQPRFIFRHTAAETTIVARQEANRLSLRA